MSVEVSNLQVPEKAGMTWVPGGTGDTGDDGCAGSGSSCQRIKTPRGNKQLMYYPSSERGGYNLSRCLIILKLYIDFYQNEKQLCHTDLSLSSIGKQTAKITWKISLLRIGMSRLRWKIRQKVLKTWQKSAQIELEVLKKVLEI